MSLIGGAADGVPHDDHSSNGNYVIALDRGALSQSPRPVLEYRRQAPNFLVTSTDLFSDLLGSAGPRCREPGEVSARDVA